MLGNGYLFFLMGNGCFDGEIIIAGMGNGEVIGEWVMLMRCNRD